MRRITKRVSKVVAVLTSTALLFSMAAVELNSNENKVNADTDISGVWGKSDDHVDASDVFVTTPILSVEGDKVTFDVTNLTEEEKSLKIDIKDYEDDEVVGEDEYNLDVKSGIEDQEISLPAEKYDLITITDGNGNELFKDYELGTYIWVSNWATAEEKAIPSGTNSTENMPKMDLEGTTYRQVMMVTTSGTKMRFRFSNEYGEEPVEMKSVHVAKQVQVRKAAVDMSTDTKVTFNGGSESVTIPAGETIVSDPVEFHVNALDIIAMSTYFGNVPETITAHRGGRATMFQGEGNLVSSNEMTTKYSKKSWYFICDCSILSPADSKAVVCFGDSITDGYGTDATYLGNKADLYIRWGDYFTRRLQAEGHEHISVLNEGIGANAIFGSYPTDAGKDRFERDLTEHDGVGYCIILMGVNDMDKLSDTSKAESLIEEFKKMVDTCHKYNIKAYGAPILPFGTSSYYSEASEEVRQIVNNWMRSDESGFDAIIDFESAVADPDSEIPCILKEYTGDDGLHPYAGYDKMAEAIDLSLFD